jgi:hypothetical protein
MAAVLVLNLPGHLTHDSLTQLAEGSSGMVQSWNPVFSSWIFGTLFNWTGGTEVIVALSATLMAAAVLLTVAGPEASRLWALGPIVLLLFGPILLIHPGVVWKDVWFAHLALLGFGLVALRAQGGKWWIEPLALAFFATALLSRQTGVLVALIGALSLTALQARADMGMQLQARVLRFGLGLSGRVALVLMLAVAFSSLAKSQMKQIQIGEVGTGVRLVALFDMAGMLKRVPNAQLDRLRAAGFGTDAWEQGARATFSPERIDRLEQRPITGSRELTTSMILAQWFDLVAAHPMSYASHRLEVFAWFSGLRDQARCIPIHVGIDIGPHTPNPGVQTQPARWSPTLYHWTRSYLDTPYFAPLAWNLVSIAVAGMIAWRRAWAHPVLWLQVGGLVYSLSYLAAGFSCDFRYSYFSVAAASIGLMWACANADWRRSGTPSPLGN